MITLFVFLAIMAGIVAIVSSYQFFFNLQDSNADMYAFNMFWSTGFVGFCIFMLLG